MAFLFTTRLASGLAGLVLFAWTAPCANALESAPELAQKYQDLELIKDTPALAAKDVLLMASTVSLDFQKTLIQRLVQHEVGVFLTSSPSTHQSPVIAEMRKQAGVRVVDLNFETALWTQDRFFRFHEPKSGRAWLLPTLADSMNDDDALSGYELGVPLVLGEQFANRFAQFDDYVSRNSSIVSIDRGRGDLYFGQDLKNFVHGVAWRLAYGDGGDRLVTEHYMLIGKATYAKTLGRVERETGLKSPSEQHALLEKLFRKKIIEIGEPELSDSYLFHLDMFLTPVESADGKLKVLLGSLEYTMTEVLKVSSEKDLPAWASAFYWSKKIRAERKLKAQLNKLGIEVIPVPIFFPEPEAFGLNTGIPAVVTFNNGIFSKKKFFAARYISNREDLNLVLAAAERIVEARFRQHLDSTIEWVPGGEAIVGFGGGVRCMAGVLAQGE